MRTDVTSTGRPADLAIPAPVDRPRPLAAVARRLTLSRPRLPTVPAAPALATAAVVLLGLAEIGLLVSRPAPGPQWAPLLLPAVAAVYLAVGVVAWQRRPANRTGVLMVAGAIVWLVAGALNVPVAPLTAAGLITATVPFAVVVHLLHAFPSGHLRGRASAATVLAGYGVCLVLQAPQYLFGAAGDGPYAVLQIADRPDVASAAQWAQWAAGSCVMAATAVLLERRRRTMPPVRRRGMAPLLVYGIGAVLFVPVSGQIAVAIAPSPNWLLALEVAQLAVLAGVPLAFMGALRRGGFPRTRGLADLAAGLGAAPADRVDLAARLADALGDPSVQVAFWVPGPGTYVDLAGRPVALPEPGAERGAVEVRLGDRRVGAIAYDARLLADPGGVTAAAGVVALAFDHQRLAADLRASRARIVQAADDERRRIARDLHDGLQARLVLLAMQLDAAGADPAVRRALQAAIAEVRELAQGVLPAMLAERGLGEAVAELAARLPLPGRCDVAPSASQLPEAVESTAYFVVSEAVTNTLKHARASTLDISVARRGDVLALEVRDDGSGGARAGRGTGLRGIGDRVEALGGRLRVDSAPGRGTSVRAELPCGW